LETEMADDEFMIEETMEAGVYRQRRLTMTERWKKNGTIPPALHEAAYTFWQDFQVAQLAGRYSSWTIERVDVSSDNRDRMVVAVARAKQRVADAVSCLGKPLDDVIWDVVGNEMSLRDYAKRKAATKTAPHHATVKKWVIEGLDALAVHYGYQQRLSMKPRKIY
jgi:hypothetical protein